jgi:hypothetical protein
MPEPGTGTATPSIAKLATAFRERGLPIVHAVRVYRSDGSDVDLVRRLSVEQGRELRCRAAPIHRSPQSRCPKSVSWTMNRC